VFPISRNTFSNGVILELDFDTFIVGEHQQRLNITVGQKVVARAIFDKSHPSQRIIIVLMANDLDVNGPLTLDLSLPGAISPFELNGSGDTRKLGVGLTGIGITAQ
jgi:hypothetical protein